MSSVCASFVSSTPLKLSTSVRSPIFSRSRTCMQIKSPGGSGNGSREQQIRDMAWYRRKVRDRLFPSLMRHAEKKVDAAAAAAPDGTVASIGGAFLDEGAAGPRAGRGASLPGANSSVQDVFATGIAQFREGRYSEAEASFRAAEKGAGGLTGRLGGELALWRAQAVYAMGGPNGRKDAADILSRLEKHEDIEVRKAAAEMKFIYTAPPLPLDNDSFLKIPEFDPVSSDDVKNVRYVLAASGIGRTARPKLNKPEKYSVSILIFEREKKKHQLLGLKICRR